MIYNTQQIKMILPEYGRNIHNMVSYCLGIEDPQERTRCAYGIVEIMGELFPHLRDVNDFKHILWDHLAIMSDFKLDIDYPYAVVTKENMNTKPESIEYSRPTMRYRHYGKTLEEMVQIAVEMEEGDEKEQFTILVATHMKKSYIQWNKDVEDGKIFNDLYELSKGKIDLTNSKIKLPDMRDLGQRQVVSNVAGKKGRRR